MTADSRSSCSCTSIIAASSASNLNRSCLLRLPLDALALRRRCHPLTSLLERTVPAVQQNQTFSCLWQTARQLKDSGGPWLSVLPAFVVDVRTHCSIDTSVHCWWLRLSHSCSPCVEQLCRLKSPPHRCSRHLRDS